MSTFREAIAELIDRHPTRPPLDQDSSVMRIARKMALPDMGERSGSRDYEAVAADCLAELAAGNPLSKRRLGDAPWVIWETQWAISGSDKALANLLAQIETVRTRTSARSLALSYLYTYHPGAPGIEAVAACLKRLVEVAREPFPRLDREWRIFDGREGPSRLAQIAVEKQRAPTALMMEERFSPAIARGNFAKAATFDTLVQLSARPMSDPDVRLAFVKDLAIDEKGALYFGELGPSVADALLLPFRGAQPAEDVCDRYLDVLVGLFGDPRTNSGLWSGMPEAAEIARGWLTRQALRQFLDVVDAVAPDNMWSYRRKFWEAVYEKKLISAAWVALDSHGQEEARRRFGRRVRFGSLRSGSGIQRGHSVLMLRIGKEVCVEWSHNGQCRFWADASREGAPKLYCEAYSADELRHGARYAPVLEVTHYPHTGLSAWQHKVARRIHIATGVAVHPSEYL